MSFIIKWGGAATAILSLLLVSRELSASTPDMSAIAVAPIRAVSEPAAPAITPQPTPGSLPSQERAPAQPAFTTPGSLRQLVMLRSERNTTLGRQDECLARAVYREAANQPLQGQLAVAQVILNRARSREFPRDVCAVIDQPGQFPITPMPPADPKSWKTAVAVASLAFENHAAQVAPDALFFHATYVRPNWSQSHQRIAQIGDHIFYR